MVRAEILKIEKTRNTKRKSYVSAIALGAVIGFLGGLISMLTASILSVVGWFIGRQNAFRYEEVLLFMASLILLMSGAHCLDKIDEARKKEREK
jgi:high-affinity Fe2+/Pb2+ permease